MRSSYINSPSYRAEKAFAKKVLLFVAGTIVLLLMAAGGFLNLEGGLPQPVPPADYVQGL